METWERLIRTWKKQLPAIVFSAPDLGDLTGGRRRVTAVIQVVQRGKSVAFIASITIDEEEIKVDPWSAQARSRLQAVASSSPRAVLVEWFTKFLDTIPLGRLRAAADAVRERKPLGIVVGILFIGCSFAAVHYYRATHHLNFVREPSAGVYYDATHAPTPTYLFCWASQGNERAGAFQVLRDGSDVTSSGRLWQEQSSGKVTYCYEDRTVGLGASHVYRVALGSGLRRKISGPVDACSSCALEYDALLNKGYPLAVRSMRTTTATNLPALAFINEPRTFVVPFARRDQEGRHVDPASLNDAPANGPIRADYGDGTRATQRYHDLVHTFSKLGPHLVTFTGEGIFAGNSAQFLVEVIERKAVSDELVYRAPPDRPVLIHWEDIGSKPVTVYTKAGRRDEYQFTMPHDVQSLLNSTGGLQAVAVDGAGQVVTILPKDVRGRDVLVAYAILPPGVHNLHLAIFKFSGEPVGGKSVAVHALP